VLEEGPKLLHWNYFLALESDLERLSRFVEFTEDNFQTYSLEMARLLLAASAEVDVVLKELCMGADPDKKPKDINEYRKIMQARLPRLCEMPVRIPRFGLRIIPWQNWNSDENPDWWKAYNQVKHKRAQHFRQANLQNTIKAIAGLFVATMYLYKTEAGEGALIPLPNLLILSPKHCRTALMHAEFGVAVKYSF
jgi:hypothetical protein